MGKSRSANSVRNVSFGFAQQLITLVLAFVTRTIFVRKLGAEYTGVNGLYTNILTLLSLAEFGIGNVLTYSLYGALHDNDHEKLKQLISYYRKLYRYIAAAVTVAGLAIVPFLGQLVKSTLPHNEVVLYYLLFLCNSVVSYFVMFRSGHYSVCLPPPLIRRKNSNRVEYNVHFSSYVGTFSIFPFIFRQK